MGLTIPVGHGLASIAMNYSTDPELMFCTLGVRPLVPPLDAGAATRIMDAWRLNAMLQMASTVTLVRVDLRVRQDGGEDLLYTANAPGGATGNLTFAGASQNVAMLIIKQSARAGKRGRGRFYVPGITEDRVNPDGTIPAASRDAITAAFQNFMVALSTPSSPPAGDAVEPVLFHGNASRTEVTRPSPTQKVTTRTTLGAGPAPDLITNMFCDPRVATQRRRLR